MFEARFGDAVPVDEGPVGAVSVSKRPSGALPNDLGVDAGHGVHWHDDVCRRLSANDVRVPLESENRGQRRETIRVEEQEAGRRWSTRARRPEFRHRAGLCVGHRSEAYCLGLRAVNYGP